MPQRGDRFSERLERRDQRESFQRDRDRVLYANEFRRLAGVTQVISPDEGHVFHNRLTHTIKVGQIGRRLAEFLLEAAREDRAVRRSISREGGLNPDVVESACLAHDIGHPPFGHAAERELNAAAEPHNPEGFEGNAQSFRIVTALSLRSSAGPGLNLTRATAAAILKYPWKRGENPDYPDKWGYYRTERAFFTWARAERRRLRKTLEAAVMDWSDDVAYSVHDVDDFYRAGLVPFDIMLTESQERAAFLDHIAAQRRWADAPTVGGWGREFFDNIGELCPSLLTPFRGTGEQYAALHELTSAHIRRFLGVEVPGTVRVASDWGEPPLSIDATIAREVRLLKELMRYYVFEDPILVAQQKGQRVAVRTLFDTYFEAILGRGDYANIIPLRFRPAADAITKTGDAADAARLACDIVSGMSEQHALNMYVRITGVGRGSIFDKTVR